MEVVDIEDLDDSAEPENIQPIHEIHGGHKKVRKWIYNPKWEELPEFQKWLTKSQQTSEETVSFEIFLKSSLSLLKSTFSGIFFNNIEWPQIVS